MRPILDVILILLQMYMYIVIVTKPDDHGARGAHRPASSMRG